MLRWNGPARPAAHINVQRAVVTVTQEAIRVCGGRAFLRRYPPERHDRCSARNHRGVATGQQPRSPVCFEPALDLCHRQLLCH